MPREPDAPPDAVSLLGPDPNGPRLRWYACGHAILGYEAIFGCSVKPSHVGYRVPVDAALPDKH